MWKVFTRWENRFTFIFQWQFHLHLIYNRLDDMTPWRIVDHFVCQINAVKFSLKKIKIYRSNTKEKYLQIRIFNSLLFLVRIFHRSEFVRLSGSTCWLGLVITGQTRLAKGWSRDSSSNSMLSPLKFSKGTPCNYCEIRGPSLEMKIFVSHAVSNAKYWLNVDAKQKENCIRIG
jgi:hypothetical protein